MIGNNKSEKILRKSLLRNTFIVKLYKLSLQLCQKTNPISSIFQVIRLHIRNPCFKEQQKKNLLINFCSDLTYAYGK